MATGPYANTSVERAVPHQHVRHIQGLCGLIRHERARTEGARGALRSCKKGGTAEARWRAEAHDARRQWTFYAAQLRAYLGDEAAARRFAWCRLAREHREKIADAWQEYQAQLHGADEIRARVERGTTAKGQPLARSTVRNYRQMIAGLERSALESVRLLRSLTERRISPYRDWRASVSDPARSATEPPAVREPAPVSRPDDGGRVAALEGFGESLALGFREAFNELKSSLTSQPFAAREEVTTYAQQE